LATHRERFEDARVLPVHGHLINTSPTRRPATHLVALPFSSLLHDNLKKIFFFCMQQRPKTQQQFPPPHHFQLLQQISAAQPWDQLYNPDHNDIDPHPGKKDLLKELFETARQVLLAIHGQDLDKLHSLGHKLTNYLPFLRAAEQHTRSFQAQPPLPQLVVPGPSLAQGGTTAAKKRRRTEEFLTTPVLRPNRRNCGCGSSRNPSSAFIKKCLDCGKSDTSQWRSGPQGMSTLCNACGMRHWRQKQQKATKKRRTAETPTTTAGDSCPSPDVLSASSSPQPDEPGEPSLQPERKQSSVYFLLN